MVKDLLHQLENHGSKSNWVQTHYERKQEPLKKDLETLQQEEVITESNPLQTGEPNIQAAETKFCIKKETP